MNEKHTYIPLVDDISIEIDVLGLEPSIPVAKDFDLKKRFRLDETHRALTELEEIKKRGKIE